MKDPSICFFVGTRPEIIKLWSVIREAENQQMDFSIVHTGQHSDWEMSYSFFKELKIPSPEHFLGSKSSEIHEIESLAHDYLRDRRPPIAVVLGDTNSALAVSLAACKLGIKLGHVEAGCRSHDRTMPEEVNRVIIADCADLNFAPTRSCMRNLMHEDVPGEIVQSGHPLVRTVEMLRPAIQAESGSAKYGLERQEYVFLTLHRPENVDNKDRLRMILNAVAGLGSHVLFPVHPRTQKRIISFGLDRMVTISSDRFLRNPPLPYLETLRLLSEAALVVTDSGGLQQEAFLLRIPCATVRRSFEWVETFEAGVNFLVNPEREAFAESLQAIYQMQRDVRTRFENLSNVFGDSTAPFTILDRLRSLAIASEKDGRSKQSGQSEMTDFQL